MTLPLSRRSILAGLSLAMTSTAMAQTTPQTDQPAAVQRGRQPAEVITHPRASSFDFGPEGAVWRIFVGVPDAPPPPEGYSLLLTTDGNATFPIFWNHREQMAPKAPVLLVSIGYPVTTSFDVSRRWFDLTSPGLVLKIPQQPGTRDSGNNATGGRTAFLDMIADQLLPELQRRYPINMADTTFYGHSLGGLFVLHVLFTRPDLFTRLASADASLWWNNGEALVELAAFAGGIRAAGGSLARPIRLLLTNSGGQQTDSARQMSSRLPELIEKLNGIKGMEITLRPHPTETHISLIKPSAADTLTHHLGPS